MDGMITPLDTRPGAKTEREKLLDEIERLSGDELAEREWRLAFPEEPNPWDGAASRLAAAESQLATLDQETRIEGFRNLVSRYRAFCKRLRDAEADGTADRIAEIQRAQIGSDGYQAVCRGAHRRTGDPVNPADAKEREAAKKYVALEQERCTLATQLANARESRSHLEKQYPWLAALGAQIDADSLAKRK